MEAKKLKRNALFNPSGDTEIRLRKMIGGNTTNLNDFNNMRYKWVSDWYRQAMNNFWIPEEINLTQDTKDYPLLDEAERTAYDKILSFLVFLDSLQSNNLPTISEYITANEVNLCLHIQAFQECVHSQSYSYMLDTICSPEKRNDILYQWKTDERARELYLEEWRYLELSRVSYCLALSGKPDEWGNTYDVNTYDKQEGTDPNGGSYWYQRIMHYNEFYNKNPELIVKNHKYTIDKRNLYLPIPQSAIDANRLGKLRQNYGYDKYDDSVPMWGNWQEAVADEDNLSN